VLSATNIAIDPTGAPPNGCEANAPSVTSFGSVTAGSSTVTSLDCNIVWGSSNDSAMLRLYQTDQGGSALLPQPVTGIEGYWPLNNNLADIGAGGNAFTLASAPNDANFVSGPAGHGTALEFDADDTGATAPNRANQALTTFTVDAWVRFPAPLPAASSEVVLSRVSAGALFNFQISVVNTIAPPDESVFFTVSHSGGTQVTRILGPYALDDGAWHHLAFSVLPDRTRRMYVDGVESSAVALPAVPDTPAAPIEIGMGGANLVQIDEPRISSTIRTAEEIKSYVAGRVSDYDDDDVAGDSNWLEGTDAFGACLETVTNGAAGGSGVGAWTVAGDDNCTPASTAWNPIAVSSASAGAKVAAVTPGPDIDAAVSLRFGLRTASNQPPGDYRAPISFEVLAPNA
jgi:hypothetical protein